MVHLKVAQGAVSDLPFNLRDQAGGNLVDDADWVDGTTAEEWPVSEFFTTGGDDVTEHFVKDITGETISDASHIHPDPTTGLWRKDKGRYRQRIDPVSNTATLPLGDYEWTVTYDVGGIRFDETHTITLVEAGDVEFGDEVLVSVVDAGEVKRHIDTSLSDATINDLIADAAEEVAGYLMDYYIDADLLSDRHGRIPRTVAVAVRSLTALYVFQHDGSANEVISNVREGSLAIGFAGRSNITQRQMHEELFSEDKKNPGKLYRFVRSASPMFNPHIKVATKKSTRRNQRTRDMNRNN